MTIDTVELTEQGYTNLKHIENKGICGILVHNNVIGLCYGITIEDYEGMYVYSNQIDAIKALKNWNGIGNPTFNYIRHSGSIKHLNLK